MFIELTPILKERVVMITASDIGNGFLRVNVIPKTLGTVDNPALTAPLTIIGTAEELDRDLAAQLARLSQSEGHFSRHRVVNIWLSTVS
jgi:PRTRC genetic system protein E